MVITVLCLMHRHEDLVPNPRSLTKEWAWWCALVIPALGGEDRQISLNSLASQPRSLSEFQISKILTVSNRHTDSSWEAIPEVGPWLHTHSTRTCIHMYTSIDPQRERERECPCSFPEKAKKEGFTSEPSADSRYPFSSITHLGPCTAIARGTVLPTSLQRRYKILHITPESIPSTPFYPQ